MTKVLEQELEEVREVRGGNIFNLESTMTTVATRVLHRRYQI